MVSYVILQIVILSFSICKLVQTSHSWSHSSMLCLIQADTIICKQCPHYYYYSLSNNSDSSCHPGWSITPTSKAVPISVTITRSLPSPTNNYTSLNHWSKLWDQSYQHFCHAKPWWSCYSLCSLCHLFQCLG